MINWLCLLTCYLTPICLGELIIQNILHWKKDTVILDVMLQNYFKDSFSDDVIYENCSSGDSKSIKSTFPVSRYLKKPPSVLKILFQRGTYDRTTCLDTKNELKVAIPSEYLFKQPSSNEQIS